MTIAVVILLEPVPQCRVVYLYWDEEWQGKVGEVILHVLRVLCVFHEVYVTAAVVILIKLQGMRSLASP